MRQAHCDVEEDRRGLGRRQNPQALGVTLASLTVNATDAKWQETFLEEVGKEIYKVRNNECQRLSPQLDPNPRVLSRLRRAWVSC